MPNRRLSCTPVAEELRARGVPFVLTSAYSRHDGPAAVTALAGVPNLGKPTDERRLLAVLTQAVTPNIRMGKPLEAVGVSWP